MGKWLDAVNEISDLSHDAALQNLQNVASSEQVSGFVGSVGKVCEVAIQLVDASISNNTCTEDESWPLQWLAAHGIKLMLTGVNHQNIYTAPGSVFPDAKAVMFIDRFEVEIMRALKKQIESSA